ncbi:MAG: barstar family protein [Thermoguttaceae bacterium]|nr:barstar family protein [Thermoguttaceae bacterium]MBQ3332201.1 barstar family protein [Thermoguttaceae bacterium]MBQ6619675.1 barstar family protein [Thermoguttaceae bacterium]
MIIHIHDFPSFETTDSITLIMSVRPLEKEPFLRFLAKKFRFPDYFGHGWDAVNDCLGPALTALKKKNITLIFPVVPLESARQWKTFRDILAQTRDELAALGITLTVALIDPPQDD